MKKFIKSKVGAVILSISLAMGLLVLTASFGISVKDGLWVKMIILIPAFGLYYYLKPDETDKKD